MYFQRSPCNRPTSEQWAGNRSQRRMMQCLHQTFPLAGAEEAEGEGAAGEVDTTDAGLTPQDRRSDRQPRETLAVRFRKIACRAFGRVSIVRDKDAGLWTVDQRDLVENTAREMQRAADVVAGDPDREFVRPGLSTPTLECQLPLWHRSTSTSNSPRLLQPKLYRDGVGTSAA